MRKFPDVQFIVDCVSSFTAMKIPFDELGIDVMLAGTQKALALPAGAAVFAVSEKAYAKAATIKDRGYYFDFLEFKKNQESSMTPTTPSISHFYALQSKLEDIMAEGLEARYARHLENAKITRAWAKERGFNLFPKEGYESITLTCVSEQQEHRCAEADRHAQDEAFVRDRRRLREDQGDELPHFDHGRREHGEYPAAARLDG
jgi:aspartate aminotransferase-like enzyme